MKTLQYKIAKAIFEMHGVQEYTFDDYTNDVVPEQNDYYKIAARVIGMVKRDKTLNTKSQ